MMPTYKSLVKWSIWILFLSILCLPFVAHGQSGSLKNTGGVSCPASGSSAQVLDIRAPRLSYSLNNDTGVDVRIGFLATGTATLTDSNSFILKAGQTYTDAIPGIYYGRVVCMSTTAVAQTIHFDETYR